MKMTTSWSSISPRDWRQWEWRRTSRVAIISRLDFPVSGIVIVAKDPVSANHLHSQFSERRTRKIYHALVSADISPAAAELTNWIVKSKRHRKVHVVDEASAEVQSQQAQEARLRYKTLAQFSSHTLLEVELLTGRKHQIRAQLAAHGFPVLGDYKYKSPEQFPTGIALLSKRLELTHPASDEAVDWEVGYPDYWPDRE
jgi:23S rRNA pseudouridine1911/1915/1917 synthase